MTSVGLPSTTPFDSHHSDEGIPCSIEQKFEVSDSLRKELEASLRGAIRGEVPDPERGSKTHAEYQKERVWVEEVRKHVLTSVLAHLIDELEHISDPVERVRIWSFQHMESVIDHYFVLHENETPEIHKLESSRKRDEESSQSLRHIG
jgi:hypothetical protein